MIVNICGDTCWSDCFLLGEERCVWVGISPRCGEKAVKLGRGMCEDTGMIRIKGVNNL